MRNISAHITYREATYSRTAIIHGIDNTPNDQQLENMRFIAEVVFEPLRILLGDRSISINSFFRCKGLNKLVGGSPTSQHLCEGNNSAMDLDNDNNIKGPANKEIFDAIRANMIYDQLIWEHGDDDHPEWIHVSIINNGFGYGYNRLMVLRSYYDLLEKKVKYIPI